MIFETLRKRNIWPVSNYFDKVSTACVPSLFELLVSLGSLQPTVWELGVRHCEDEEGGPAANVEAAAPELYGNKRERECRSSPLP